jgi:hypothetical protein
MPDGRVFIDSPQTRLEDGSLLHRGGPDHPRHYCVFEDYKLEIAERCKKCGLVRDL